MENLAAVIEAAGAAATAEGAPARKGRSDEAYYDEVADRVDAIEYAAFKKVGADIEMANAPERHEVRSAAWAGFGMPL